jgi:hypothetical protein
MTAPASPSPTALPIVRIVGFTGHRRVEKPEAVAEAFRKAIASLRKEGQELLAISSLAVGADTIFAREALAAGLKWIALLPMPREAFRDDFTPEDWKEAEGLLTQAAEVRTSPSGDRPQCYLDCGKLTVDDSDILVALWNGQPAHGPGGTAEIVAYARSIGREITLLREADGEVNKIDSQEIAAATRDPDSLVQLMGPAPDLPAAPSALKAHFLAADDLANRTAPNYRHSTLRMSGYNLAASVVAAFAFALGARAIWYPAMSLTVFKTLLLLTAFVAVRRLKWSRARDTWLQQRLIAEYCRSIMATWNCRDFVEPISEYAFPEIRELARSALFLRLGRGPQAEVDPTSFRAFYAHERVLDQHNYFRKQADKAQAELGPLRQRYRAYTVGALGISILLFFVHLFLPGYSANTYASMPIYFRLNIIVLDMMPVLLPAMAAFAMTRISVNELDRRIGRYRDLQHKMHIMLVNLSFCNSWESLTRTVERTEKILFHEVLEWYSIGKHS